MFYLNESDFYEKMQLEVLPTLKASKKSGYFNSYDHTQIYYEYYIHPNEKASVVISHGFSECTEKYEEVIYYFYKRGYSVFILDHRGHGRSARQVANPSKVYVKSFDEYVRDFAIFVKGLVYHKSLSKKYVLFAHSMGGAIASLVLEKYPTLFDCAILSSPMLKMNYGIVPQGMAPLLKTFSTLLHLKKLFAVGQHPFDGLPHYKESSCMSKVRYDYCLEKRRNNPKFHMYGATYGWTCAGMDAVKKLQDNVSRIQTPVLLFQAKLDNVVNPDGQTQFASANPKFVKFVRVAGSKHEIFNAPYSIRTRYYEMIFHFIDNNTRNH